MPSAVASSRRHAGVEQLSSLCHHRPFALHHVRLSPLSSLQWRIKGSEPEHLPPSPCNSAANYCWKDNPRHYTWRGAEWLFKLWSKTEIVICAGMPGSCTCARSKLTKCICPFPVEHFKIFPCFELHAPISWSLLWRAANVNLILCCLGISAAVTSLSMSSSTCTHVEIKIYPWKHHCKKGQLYNRVISCFLTELIL